MDKPIEIVVNTLGFIGKEGSCTPLLYLDLPPKTKVKVTIEVVDG